MERNTSVLSRRAATPRLSHWRSPCGAGTAVQEVFLQWGWASAPKTPTGDSTCDQYWCQFVCAQHQEGKFRHPAEQAQAVLTPKKMTPLVLLLRDRSRRRQGQQPCASTATGAGQPVSPHGGFLPPPDLVLKENPEAQTQTIASQGWAPTACSDGAYAPTAAPQTHGDTRARGWGGGGGVWRGSITQKATAPAPPAPRSR